MSQIQAKVKKVQQEKLVGVYLQVKGRIPSKKNSRLLFVRGGRLMNIPSKEYAAWHKDALIQLDAFSTEMVRDVECVELSFWAPDRRSADLTNKAESVMDLLVDKGILEDDNWWEVNRVILNFKGVDKADPRCDIFIHRNNNHVSRL